MKNKAFTGITLTLLLIGMLTLAFNIQQVKAEPATWYVDDDGGADFTKIQDAINAASSGDTIYVYNGTYFENLNVNKDNLKIVGESKSGTIIDGCGWVVIDIYKKHVSISGFTVQNGGQSWYYIWGSAILLDYAQYCNISDNIVSSSRYGITSYRGKHNIINGNTISDTNQGIPLCYTLNETAIGNDISIGVQYGGDPPYGIQVYGSINNTIMGNTVKNISYTGIRLTYATRNIVTGNIVTNTSVGIAAEYTSTFNTILGNTASNNEIGIEVHGQSNNNTITLNKVSNNTIDGIRIGSSLGTSVSHNNITSNSCNGVYISHSSGNKVYKNMITKNAEGVSLIESSNNVISENNITANYGNGVWLFGGSDNVISGNNITNNGYSGIYCLSSSYNTISGNNLANNHHGIWLSAAWQDGWFGSFNNTVSSNMIKNNFWGVWLLQSSNNTFYHNNFIDNNKQVFDSSWYYPQYYVPSINVWDDGYPSGGNYWSDYADVDEKNGPSQDLPGSDGIWDHPYVIDSENRDRYPLTEPWRMIIPAIIDLDPNTLNLRSQGQWITAYIELPENCNVSDIDVSSIMLDNVISVDLTAPHQINDYDGDGILDLMVKFNRTELTSYIYNVLGIELENVTLTVSGQLYNGTLFEGDYTIRAILSGDINGDGVVDIFDLSAVAINFGTMIEEATYEPEVDLNNDGVIDMSDLSIVAINLGATIPE